MAARHKGAELGAEPKERERETERDRERERIEEDGEKMQF
jgi:hypothetical protein